MSLLSNRRLQAAILIALLLTVIGYSIWIYLYTHDSERLGYAPRIPTDGIAENDTKGLVPGDPKNGERALKNVWNYYQIYKQLHGQYPPDYPDLDTDIIHNPQAYGGKSIKEIFAKTANPDNRYSDNLLERGHPETATYSSDPKRPDGSPRYASKPADKHDVLIFSTTYLHENIRQYPGKQTTSNPVGFYQVLYDDGRVENVPYDKIKFVQISQPGSRSLRYQLTFPEQAGVPESALSYDDYYHKVAHYKTPPHGAPGAEGKDYQGKPINP